MQIMQCKEATRAHCKHTTYSKPPPDTHTHNTAACSRAHNHAMTFTQRLWGHLTIDEQEGGGGNGSDLLPALCMFMCTLRFV